MNNRMISADFVQFFLKSCRNFCHFSYNLIKIINVGVIGIAYEHRSALSVGATTLAQSLLYFSECSLSSSKLFFIIFQPTFFFKFAGSSNLKTADMFLNKLKRWLVVLPHPSRVFWNKKNFAKLKQSLSKKRHFLLIWRIIICFVEKRKK